MLRWQQAGGQRHALDSALPPSPDEPFRALCGTTVTPGRKDFAALGGRWFDPTCWTCDGVWREINNWPRIEVNPQ